MKKLYLKWGLIALAAVAAAVAVWQFRQTLAGWFDWGPGPQTVTVSHSVVVEKIEALGRMELIRYHFSNVVDYKQASGWMLVPDSRVILIVEGEAIGCVDFAKLDSSAVQLFPDSIAITLPEPEVCVHKVDLSRSRVFDTRYTMWKGAQLVDQAYKSAEEEILKSALQAGILDQTRRQAEQMLQPMLEGLSGRKVRVLFPPAMGPQPG
jgi:hypothetical protein